MKKPHCVWSSGGNTAETRKATQKARLLKGTYTLQTNKATFNQFAIDATCPLCGEAPEDRQHFILNCSTLHVIRAKYLTEVNHLIPNFNDFDPEDKLLILLDSSYPRLRCNRADLEAVSRSYIYSLHCKRTSILKLQLPRRASNMASRAELGRLPLRYHIIFAMLKYQFRCSIIITKDLVSSLYSHVLLALYFSQLPQHVLQTLRAALLMQEPDP